MISEENNKNEYDKLDVDDYNLDDLGDSNYLNDINTTDHVESQDNKENSLKNMAVKEGKEILTTSIGDAVSVGATFGISALIYLTMAIFPEAIAPFSEMLRGGVAPYLGGKVGELTTNIVKKVIGKTDKNKEKKKEKDKVKEKKKEKKKDKKKDLNSDLENSETKKEKKKGKYKNLLNNIGNTTVGTIGAVGFYAAAATLTASLPVVWTIVVPSIAAMTGGYLGEKYVIPGIKKGYNKLFGKKGELGIIDKANSIEKKNEIGNFGKTKSFGSYGSLLKGIDVEKQKEEVTKVVKDLVEQDKGAEIVELAVRGTLKLGRIGAVLTGTTIGEFGNLADDIIIPMAVSGILLAVDEIKKGIGLIVNKIKHKRNDKDLKSSKETLFNPDDDLESIYDGELYKSNSEVTLDNSDIGEYNDIETVFDESPNSNEKELYSDNMVTKEDKMTKSDTEKELNKEKLLVEKSAIEGKRKGNKINRDIKKIEKKNEEYEEKNSYKIKEDIAKDKTYTPKRENSNDGFNDRLH